MSDLTWILGYSKFKLSAADQKSLLQLYLPFAKIVALSEPLPPLPSAWRDVDDEMFIQLALAGEADFLVTGDKDLLALQAVTPVRIVTIEAWKGFLT